ncbi:hypothetical protein DRH29_04335, partial [candidate division Kazan bacterium]
DTIPPVVEPVHPHPGDTLPSPEDAEVLFSSCDITEYSTGVDSSSIEVFLIHHEMIINVTDSIRLEPNRCMGYEIYLPPILDVYEPGGHYIVEVGLADNAGNEAGGRTEFYIGEAPVDSFPPCVAHWVPADGDTNVPITTSVSAAICDLCDATHGHSTGVDPETIQMWILIDDGEWEEVTETLELVPIDCGGYEAVYRPMIEFPPDEDIYVRISAYDYAGNHLDEEISFHTAGGVLDTDSPCILEWFPESDSIVPPAERYGFVSCDICPESEPEYQTGVDPHSIEIVVITDSDTIPVEEYETMPNECMGYNVSFIPPIVGIPEGYTFTACAELSDRAGNNTNDCHTYYVGGVDTVDITPPCLTRWYPEPGSVQPPEVHIQANLCDICDPMSPSEIPSGVDSSSIRMFITIGEETIEVTEELELTRNRCMGYNVSFYPLEGLFSPGDTVTVQIVASDFAGHTIDPVMHFSIRPDAIEDTIPPCIVGWHPADGHLEGDLPWVSICDLCDTLEDSQTGVNPATIVARAIVHADTIDITEFLIIETNECMGFDVVFELPGGIRPDSFQICITARDYAENSVHDCHTFYMEAPPEDEYPPCVRNWHPEDGTLRPPEEHIWFSTCDLCEDLPIASGVNEESIFPYLLTTWGDIIPIEEFITERNRCEGYDVAFVPPYEIFEHHRESTFTACVQLEDIAGNSAEDCREFVIIHEEPVDTMPPVIGEWFPEGHTYSPAEPLGAAICDLHSGIEYASGVAASTIVMILIINGADTVDISDVLELHPIWCAGYEVVGRIESELVSDGDSIEVCLLASDFAGNSATACRNYIIHEEEDTSPPCISGWTPEPESRVEPSQEIGAVVCDLCGEDPSSGTALGVDPERLRLTVQIDDMPPMDVTEESELLGVYCMGYSIIWREHDPLPYGAEIEACVEAYDFADNRTYDCINFSVVGEEDTIPPVISGWIPEDGAIGVPPEHRVGATICGGVDSSTIEMSIISEAGDTFDPFAYGYVYLIPASCGGYRVFVPTLEFLWRELIFPGELVTVCLYAEDEAGRSSHSCITFRMIGDGPFATLIAPTAGSFTACNEQPITILIEDDDGVDPETIILEVNEESYVIGSPELDFAEDTLIFAPSAPYEGEVVSFNLVAASDIYGNGLENPFEGLFYVDTVPPEITWVRPEDSSTVYSESRIIEVGLHDSWAGVNPRATTIAIAGGVFGLGSPGFHWGTHSGPEPEGFTFIPSEAGIYFEPGDTVEYCVHTEDIVDYCEPNQIDSCFHFFIEPIRTHLLTGFVRARETLAPLPEVAMRAFHRFVDSPPITTTTNEFGYYEIELPDGRYILGAFPSRGSGYRPMFYDHQPDPLSADVIRLNPALPETLSGYNFELPPVYPALYRVSGYVTEEDDGPINRVYVVAISSDEDDARVESAVTDEAGYYELQLHPGTYYMVAFHPDYLPAYYGGGLYWRESSPVTVDESDVDGINFSLTPVRSADGGLHFSGTVVEVDSSFLITEVPVRGAMIYLKSSGSDEILYTSVTDQEGYFIFEDIAPGSYRVLAQKTYYEFIDTDNYQFLQTSEENVVFRMRRLPTDIGVQAQKPDKLTLQAYPNPFNSSVAIRFVIPEADEINLSVYNLVGDKIAELGNGFYKAGNYVSFWDAT